MKNDTNSKYVIPGAIKYPEIFEFLNLPISSELVFYSDGTLNVTPEDIGTFNFFTSGDLGGTLGHAIFDVLPYMLWGNSPEDTTTMLERLDAFLIDGVQDGSKDLIENLFLN